MRLCLKAYAHFQTMYEKPTKFKKYKNEIVEGVPFLMYLLIAFDMSKND